VHERRLKAISSKVSVREYEVIAARAGTLTVSEWARQTLMEAAQPNQFPFTLLAEMTALRIILLNAHYSVANGHPLSVDEMRQLVERADADRWRRAEERLAAFRTRNSSQKY
jgi:hypothetical protein